MEDGGGSKRTGGRGGATADGGMARIVKGNKSARAWRNGVPRSEVGACSLNLVAMQHNVMDTRSDDGGRVNINYSRV